MYVHIASVECHFVFVFVFVFGIVEAWKSAKQASPKSVCWRRVIEVFVTCFHFPRSGFCWYRTFFHRSESDLLLFKRKRDNTILELRQGVC